MKRIDTATKVADLFGAGKHGWRNSNLGLAIAATDFNADWTNHVQEEIANVVEGAGLVLNGADYTQLLQAIRLLTAPPGEVAYFARNSAPTGFLKANGALVPRSTYAALFTAIGTTFGVGDGATTFALPDMRGEFPRGWDDARGIDAGRVFGSAQLDAFQGHWHTAYRNSSDTPTGGTGITFGSNGANTLTGADDIVRAPIIDGTNGTPRTSTETRPRNIALLACIKY